MDWIDERDKEIQETRAKAYFDIVEGSQTFVLLSHCAPLAQVYEPATKKYRMAVDGERGASIKGLCWVLQDGVIKQAKLPYMVVKAIRAIQQNADWEFTIPFRHTLTLKAEGAETKEVKYSLTASPKSVTIPVEILEELKKNPTPEAIIEKMREASDHAQAFDSAQISSTDYPEEVGEVDQF